MCMFMLVRLEFHPANILVQRKSMHTTTAEIKKACHTWEKDFRVDKRVRKNACLYQITSPPPVYLKRQIFPLLTQIIARAYWLQNSTLT